MKDEWKSDGIDNWIPTKEEIQNQLTYIEIIEE